ncbi:hypothetical protein F4553_002166 [Allocatelliglobosispora scoriae]|uniref:DUF3558 domain-containing protein n=1 Tax=Allocatelliglobosispora scoriae TaxID=643052 RepID=A0A841BI46_9ACTN|nr:hypothetical protein [Allocatelliglobosispora scoriae]MBB5868787.1 hypothetical protein [Allocatelliglobosispora scoriae]
MFPLSFARAAAVAVACGVVLTAGGCSHRPQQPAAPAAASCATEIEVPAQAVLQVDQVWPHTTSHMAGFQAAALDPAGCTDTAPTTAAACDKPFPWVAGTPAQAYATLAREHASTVVSGFIRGHRPVPEGTVIEPQEIRESIVLLDPAVVAATTVIARHAGQCGDSFTGGNFTAYRVPTRSDVLDVPIDGILVAARNLLIWLEFDERGWAPTDYGDIVAQAVANAVTA